MREKFKKKLNDRFDKKMFIKAILGSYLIFNNDLHEENILIKVHNWAE